ncbi:MAG: hypothetical protein IJ644_01250 [Oscillospiraceae bacterium]|nr:hypothetical protein [Oscillospiraceae bacterium]
MMILLPSTVRAEPALRAVSAVFHFGRPLQMPSSGSTRCFLGFAVPLSG